MRDFFFLSELRERLLLQQPNRWKSRMAIWVVGILLLAVVGGGDKGTVAASGGGSGGSSSSTSSSCGFPAIYNFGDDNSDTGESAAAYDEVDFPNGQTFFGKPSGRYCDGRLIVDFMAEQLGLPFLSPYLESIESNFSHGANFAMGGERVVDTTLFTLGRQVFQFIQFKSRTTALYNQLSNQSNEEASLFKSRFPTPGDFSKALYVIDIGQNDLAHPLVVDTYGASPIKSPTEQARDAVPRMIPEFSRLLTILHEYEGARYFWIHNVGPVGCLPYTVKFCQNQTGGGGGAGCKLDQNGCVKERNDIVQDFNRLLKEEVSKARAKYPNATFTYVDVYSAKYNLISQAKNLGFEDPLKLCCGSYEGGKYIPCGQKELNGSGNINGTTPSAACNDPSKYISWDGLHFTEAANQYLSKLIINGSLSDLPVPLPQACNNINKP